MKTSIFGKLPDGTEVPVYTLQNGSGMTMEVIPYGCRIISLYVKDREGTAGNVILGHRTLEEYYADYHGAVIGRYANRIKAGKFTLNGKTYQLEKNDGDNSLHGGPGGFHNVMWTVEETAPRDGAAEITFTYTSADGEEGFPAELQTTVKYTLTADNTLRIDYTAKSDAETVVNLTNHAYFNLSGKHDRDILDTELVIYAPFATEKDAQLIPTGKLIPVSGKALDFTVTKPLGQDMFSTEKTVSQCGGYDHNFCVEGKGFRRFAQAYDPSSGRVMDVYCDLPGVQLYTFNEAFGTNSDGMPMKPHTAFCLETQYYPDSPNQPSFPFTTVKPGAPLVTRTEYHFSTK